MPDKIICNASYPKLDTLLDALFPGVVFHRKDSGKVDKASPDEKYLINVGSLNDRQQIDGFLEQINSELSKGDFFVGCADYETSKMIKAPQKILFNVGKSIDALITDIRASVFSKSRNTRLSKMEILGRIYRKGFTIKDLQKKDNFLYFIAQKNISL